VKIICFPHFYYLSEVSRLVEIAKALRAGGQDTPFFSHGGPYEHVARDAGFEVVSVDPQMSPERARQFMRFNRGEGIKSLRDSFFTYEELKEYVPSEAAALKDAGADAVLIGWNLPSYLSVQLAQIPIIVQQPGPFTAPFFDRRMGVFVPSLVGWLRHLPMDWFMNWLAPRMKFWIYPFNRLASELGLQEYKSTLDFVAGDLTLVMDAPEILGISPEQLDHYEPRHPQFFRRPPLYRYGGPCFAKLPGEVPEAVRRHFDTPRTKLFCAMGVSGSPEVLRSVVDIVADLDLQAVVLTTTILGDRPGRASERVLTVPHAPAHLVNPLADIAITHGGAGTVQTAIHSGTPLVGIPAHMEQAGNISLVTRQGAGLMLTKLDLDRARLADALEKLVADHSYRDNMHRLKRLQDPIDGAARTAEEIVRFLGDRKVMRHSSNG
jgi:UDP:flavonoid glycosyltransferase YjiC (YdhE family)